MERRGIIPQPTHSVTRVFLDTNVFVYALRREHRYRDPCRAIVDQLQRGELAAETSVGVVGELIYVRGRRGSGGYREAAQRAAEITELTTVHPVEPRDLHDAISTLSNHPTVQPGDALHAAVALNRGINSILTADRSFEMIEGLQRIDPLDADAVDSLSRH